MRYANALEYLGKCDPFVKKVAENAGLDVGAIRAWGLKLVHSVACCIHVQYVAGTWLQALMQSMRLLLPGPGTSWQLREGRMRSTQEDCALALEPSKFIRAIMNGFAPS